MITLKLLDTIPEIENKVNAALAQQVNNILSQKQTILLSKAQALISQWIQSQPEIQSLQSNDSSSLAGQFGLYPGQASNIVNVIASSIQNSVQVIFKKFTKNLLGGLEINFQPKNFLNLLSLPQGLVDYDDGSLHWLEWLLLKGDTIIVTNYQYNPRTGIGRSGLGNMVAGGSFRVPPQFSGTEDDNFVTRALIGPSQEKEIAQIFQEILK